MTGTIRYISPVMTGKVSADKYQIVSFLLENGNPAKTFVVHRFKNSSRWIKIMKEGAVLGGLVQMKNGDIDADSPVKLL